MDRGFQLSAAWIITGRTLVDWAFCGKLVPRDQVHLTCLFCKAPLTVSAEGARILEAKKRDPQFGLCGAACGRCIKREGAVHPVAGIETTTTGAALLDRSQNARDLVQFLMERAK